MVSGAGGIRTEERTASGGQTVTSRRNDLLAVRVLAVRRRAPTWLAVQIVLLEFQSRGVSLALGEADEIARRVLAAEEYPMFGADGR